jgi:hypothetical protein
MAGLQKELWVAGIIENPIPDHSFVMASTDMSEHVENNKLHLAEAGLEPAVIEDYFVGNEVDLPTATITDVPSEVLLRTYSTEQTRHRDLQETELSYKKRESVVKRHAAALAKNIGKRAAYNWAPQLNDTFNKVTVLGATDKVVDAIIDMELFYADLDMTENLNICLTPAHMAKLKKEDLVLYKLIKSDKGADLYGFKVYGYSNCPLFTSLGVKKPFGAVAIAGDKKASITWCSDETFRCFGDVKAFETLGAAGSQADNISYAQRALVGNIRASNPKYRGAIV